MHDSCINYPNKKIIRENTEKIINWKNTFCRAKNRVVALCEQTFFVISRGT